MSTSETGASSVIWTSDIINSPKKRYEKVKEEKQRRIKEWKNSLTELTESAKRLLDKYNVQKGILKTKIRFGEDVEQNQEKLDKLKKRIEKLEKDKYTDSDLAEQKARIAQEIMDECEGSVCPFCGKIFGSDGEVKSHLNMTDEEMEKMNKVALRDPNYRQKYIKEKGINEFDMDVKLDDGEIAKVKVGEQIHHIVSVDPYSSTLRVSRLGNLAGFDINELPNLTALPYAKNISDFPENFQSVIQESIVKKIEMQYHDGPHNYSEEGLISYEDQMVQKMSEIEQAVLEKSRQAGGCIGQTKEGREQVCQDVKKELEKFRDECREKLENFGAGMKPGIYTHKVNVALSKKL